MFSTRFSALQVYLTFAAVWAFFFSTYGVLSSVYRFETAGLNPFQLVLVGTVLELSVFIFEVPTGVVADVYSRRRSVIIGMFLFGLGFMLEGALPLFATILLAQVLWGIGATFESGAIDAWVTDEIGEQNAGQAFIRATQVHQLMSLFGIGLGVLLGQLYLGLPMIVAGVGFLGLAVFLILFMPERGFKANLEANHNPLKSIRDTFTAGLQVAGSKRIILIIFAITAILGVSSETFDRLWEAHFLEDIGFPALFSPVLWFGIIAVATSLLSLGITEIVRRRVDTNSHVAVARALLTINTGMTLTVIVFGIAGNFFLALLFYMASVLLRTSSRPLYTAWLNQKLEPQTRATVFSMNAQMDALGQIAGGPLLGLMAASLGMPFAFVMAGLLLLPAGFLYRRALLQRREPFG